MKHTLTACVLSAVLATALAGCATLCKIPGVGSLPGVTCPTPTPGVAITVSCPPQAGQYSAECAHRRLLDAQRPAAS